MQVMSRCRQILISGPNCGCTVPFCGRWFCLARGCGMFFCCLTQTDPSLEDYNVQSRVDSFVDAVNNYYLHNAKTGHIMFQMGSDFQYEVQLSSRMG